MKDTAKDLINTGVLDHVCIDQVIPENPIKWNDTRARNNSSPQAGLNDVLNDVHTTASGRGRRECRLSKPGCTESREVASSRRVPELHECVV